MRSKYEDFRCCYEASFCGTALHDTLTALGVDCAIIAPGSIPRRVGDRIKTDRRDARKLAEYFAAGLLTECFILDSELRSVRSLMRSRATLIKNLHRSKMQVIHFLHARGHSYNAGGYWTQKFMVWINKVELDYPNDEQVLRGHLADITYIQSRIQEVEQQIQTASESFRFQEPIRTLQGFRGIGLITAMQLVCEIGDFRRFEKPTALMAYLGLVPAQRSSGNTIRSGSITKTGNVHARKALVSAAWKYIHRPRISVSLRERQKHCSARTVAISQRAQKRLCKRFHALAKRKPPQVAVVALARELVGFLWEAMQAPTQTA
jgi:transposase